MIAAFPADPTPRFSMVIPAYSEEAWLPLLDSLSIASERYRDGAITTISVRRFDQHGERRSLAAIPKPLWWAVFSHKSIDQRARNYWYEDRRAVNFPRSRQLS